jgi:hypothetical protein
MSQQILLKFHNIKSVFSRLELFRACSVKYGRREFRMRPPPPGVVGGNALG